MIEGCLINFIQPKWNKQQKRRLDDCVPVLLQIVAGQAYKGIGCKNSQRKLPHKDFRKKIRHFPHIIISWCLAHFICIYSIHLLNCLKVFDFTLIFHLLNWFELNWNVFAFHNCQIEWCVSSKTCYIVWGFFFVHFVTNKKNIFNLTSNLHSEQHNFSSFATILSQRLKFQNEIYIQMCLLQYKWKEEKILIEMM